MSKVYLSGPITGLTYKQARFGWRKVFNDKLDSEIEVLSPMRHEGHLAEMGKAKLSLDPSTMTNHFFSHPKMIVAKDFLDIDTSDLMIANFLGATAISKGTLVEIGYAHKAGKPIVTIMEPGNPNDSPFVRETSACVIDNMDDAIKVVNSLLSTGV